METIIFLTTRLIMFACVVTIFWVAYAQRKEGVSADQPIYIGKPDSIAVQMVDISIAVLG